MRESLILLLLGSTSDGDVDLHLLQTLESAFSGGIWHLGFVLLASWVDDLPHLVDLSSMDADLLQCQ